MSTGLWHRWRQPVLVSKDQRILWPCERVAFQINSVCGKARVKLNATKCLQLQLFPLRLEVFGISVHWQLCCGPCGRKNDACLDSGMSVWHTMYWWEQLNLIWTTLKNLKLLIIDKISMVSSLTLLYIHFRLTEITATDQQLGALNLVVFGDLNQIPPVKGNQSFQTMTLQEAKAAAGSSFLIRFVRMHWIWRADHKHEMERRHSLCQLAESNARQCAVSDGE